MFRRGRLPLAASLLVATSWFCLLQATKSVLMVTINVKYFNPVRATDGTCKVMCATDETTVYAPTDATSLAYCAHLCHVAENCSNFNYKNYSNQQQSVCELYNLQPSNYSVVAGCLHYQIQSLVLIQQSVDGSNFFDRTWAEFKAGFGCTSGNYWIGNEMLYQLTKSVDCKLRIDVQSWENSQWYWAEYSSFTVGAESTDYKLQVSGFTGNVSNDALHDNYGMKFSTRDRDNDNWSIDSCAIVLSGGFWYNNCGIANLNSPRGAAGGAGFIWYQLTSTGFSPLQTSRLWLTCNH